MKKKNKKLFLSGVALSLASLICLTAIPIYAWFVASSNKGHIGDIEIDVPPLIYINNDNLEEMTSFNLDGLQVNTVYNFIFCVSPVKRNVVKTFLLGVIYTENIGMTINIYPVSKISYDKPEKGTYELKSIADPYDENAEKSVYFEYSNENKNWATRNETTYGNNGSTDPDYLLGNLNRGIHRTYYGLEFASRSDAWHYSSLNEALNDKSHYSFYNLQITWENNTNVDIDKEVDIVYITTKGTAKEETSNG